MLCSGAPGSGCASVGRAVASNTRGSRFESSHWQNLFILNILFIVKLCIEKTKIKKRGRDGPFDKKSLGAHFMACLIKVLQSSFITITANLLYSFKVEGKYYHLRTIGKVN